MKIKVVNNDIIKSDHEMLFDLIKDLIIPDKQPYFFSMQLTTALQSYPTYVNSSIPLKHITDPFIIYYGLHVNEQYNDNNVSFSYTDLFKMIIYKSEKRVEISQMLLILSADRIYRDFTETNKIQEFTF